MRTVRNKRMRTKKQSKLPRLKEDCKRGCVYVRKDPARGLKKAKSLTGKLHAKEARGNPCETKGEKTWRKHVETRGRKKQEKRQIYAGRYIWKKARHTHK